MSDTEENVLADCEQVISTSEDESYGKDSTERRNPSSKRKLGTGPRKDARKENEDGDMVDGDSNEGRVKGEGKTRAQQKPGLKVRVF